VWAADQAKLLFNANKYLFHVVKYEKLEGCRFFKTLRFPHPQNFSVRPFFELPKIFFSDFPSKTKYRQPVKSTLTPKIFWWRRFESRRAQYVSIDFVNLSSFSTEVIKTNILSHLTHHTTSHKSMHRFFFFSFSLSRKIEIKRERSFFKIKCLFFTQIKCKFVHIGKNWWRIEWTYRVSQNVYTHFCFAYISAWIKDKILILFFRRCAVKSSTINVEINPY
jgi:hypothetical protein